MSASTYSENPRDVVRGHQVIGWMTAVMLGHGTELAHALDGKVEISVRHRVNAGVTDDDYDLDDDEFDLAQREAL